VRRTWCFSLKVGGRSFKDTLYSCCRPGSTLLVFLHALKSLGTQEKIIRPLVLVLQPIACLSVRRVLVEVVVLSCAAAAGGRVLNSFGRSSGWKRNPIELMSERLEGERREGKTAGEDA
jgi:hypothetical protein